MTNCDTLVDMFESFTLLTREISFVLTHRKKVNILMLHMPRMNKVPMVTNVDYCYLYHKGKTYHSKHYKIWRKDIEALIQ